MEAAAAGSLEQRALAACGSSELGLRTLARGIAARALTGRGVPDPASLDWEVRASGEPHPWPRVWAATGNTLAPDETTARLETWLRGSRYAALRRCGVAEFSAPGAAHALVVVAVDALADLAPIPRTVRVGEWIAVEARMRVSVRNPRVLVLGPSGAPHTLLTSVSGATIRARFAPDRSGMFTVQVMGDIEGGSRPLLDVTVFAGVEPPTSPQDESAPGEEVGEDTANEDDRLAAMVNASRVASGRAPMQRSADLDMVARRHAARMSAAHELAHDVGDGEPLERMASAGVNGVEVGENVGWARSVAMAHRQTWNSPSHRANLLSERFWRAGFAVVRDENGEVWVVEEFAGR
jgi:uncharacterized protein YkwD